MGMMDWFKEIAIHVTMQKIFICISVWKDTWLLVLAPGV